MSQSPETANSEQPADDYRDAWLRIGRLAKSGYSWSGHERNCCFLNIGHGSPSFANVSLAVGLNHEDDGRAIARVDWDHDGDLDLWVINRTSPQVRLLRNNLQSTNHFISILLQGTGVNRDAIGARVELRFAESTRVIAKTLRAGEGYLGQSSKRIHFGLGPHDKIDDVRVRWPNGQTESFMGLQLDSAYRLVQGNGRGQLVTQMREQLKLEPGGVAPISPAAARLVLTDPVPTNTNLSYTDLDGKQQYMLKRRGQPVLLTV